MGGEEAAMRNYVVQRILATAPVMGVAGGVLLLVMLAVAALAGHSGSPQHQPHKRIQAPAAAYWFGTDMLGQDRYFVRHRPLSSLLPEARGLRYGARPRVDGVTVPDSSAPSDSSGGPGRALGAPWPPAHAP